MDIPMMMKSVRKQNFRILGKAEMAKIPIFGYIYKSAVVMVNRESAAHRVRSVKTLTSVLKKGISVFVCPEGTFNTTHQPLKDFYDGAFRIAIETQTPIKPLLFLDTYDRLPYESMLSLNPGKCRTVFLEEIDVTGFTMKDTQALKLKVYTVMQDALLKYQATWINQLPLENLAKQRND
jgi:1-acyl-sn-glycerol-3-phosphate acyltransferase